MRILVLAVALAFASPAFAQQPPPPPRTFTFTVTAEELQTIGAALEEMPHRRAAPVLAKLSQQLNAQVAPPTPPTPAPEK